MWIAFVKYNLERTLKELIMWIKKLNIKQIKQESKNDKTTRS
jgi:hypothetical protein